LKNASGKAPLATKSGSNSSQKLLKKWHWARSEKTELVRFETAVFATCVNKIAL
jgi:hypothetical protein